MRPRTGAVVVGATSPILICLMACAPSQSRVSTPGVDAATTSVRATGRPPPSLLAAARGNRVSSTPATCRDRSLILTYDPSVAFQATGERGDAFRVTYRGRSACHVAGYPEATLSDHLGALVPFRYTEGHSQYIAHRRPQPVTLKPGRWAYLGVAKYRCDLGDLASATTLTVMLPGQHAVISVALSGRALNLDYCEGGPDDPGNTVAISPIEPTPERILG